jgi:hypothetical protein
LGIAPAQAASIFSNWAVMIVAGDDHAHDGSPSDVFDNARRDLAKEFAGIGFSPGNMVQFSVENVPDAQHTAISAIANGLWDVSNRAPGGCLIYFTSHGAPDGIVTDDKLLAPDKFSAMVNNACGAKPSVIVMSSCFSGIFVPALMGPNRIVMSAARPDRTSFGCGNDTRYTFFDQCFLQSIPQSGDFPGVADKVRQCVAVREQKEGMTPPSEPQVAVGDKVVYTLRWR